MDIRNVAQLVTKTGRPKAWSVSVATGLLQSLRARAELLEATAEADIAVGGDTVDAIQADRAPYHHGALCG
jgi:hypothetical protein